MIHHIGVLSNRIEKMALVEISPDVLEYKRMLLSLLLFPFQWVIKGLGRNDDPVLLKICY